MPMDAVASPLILTKLRPPGARPRTVLRPRLLARLSAGIAGGVVLACAPAGYGKTTILAEWARTLQQAGAAVAWYALDPGDAAPSTFGAYLVAGLAAAIGPDPGLAAAAERLRTSPEVDLLALLPPIVNAVAGSSRDCVLMLDDYHLIDAAAIDPGAIHSLLAALIDHLPENMRVVIGSRSDPPLALARLRSRGRLHEVRAVDLRFTVDEAAGFLNEVMQLGVSAELVEGLAARTEGWVAGLQLAALSLAGRADRENFVASFGGSHRYLVEYLLEEVVGGQSEEVQRFLLCTSVLERLHGPLCDALLAADAPEAEAERPVQGDSPGEAILAHLEAANLFLVALDDQAAWYRYHHLFRDFLAGRLLKTAAGRVPILHRAAAEWHGSHGYLREAVGHALQVGDWDYAADVVERCCFPMMMRSELSTIYEWCAAFPEEVMARRPMLCINEAWTLVLGARRQNRSRAEARLRQAEAAAAAAVERDAAAALSEHASTVRSYLSLVPDPALDPRKELDLARGQLSGHGEADASQFSMMLKAAYAHLALQEAAAAEAALEAARRLAVGAQLAYGVLETTYQLARLAQSQGRPDQATALCFTSRGPVEETLPAVGCLDVALGCVHLDQGRLVEAENALLAGLARIGSGINPYPAATACLALFRLCEAQGRAAEGLGFLARLEAAWPDAAFCTQGLRVLHRLKAAPGDPDAAAAAVGWAAAFSRDAAPGSDMPAFGLGPLGGAEIYYAASLAWACCNILAGHAQGSGRGAATAYLQRQLALAEANGLAARAAELAGLLALARTRGPTPPQPPLRAYPDIVETLSERELEVLRLMAAGATNQEIADRLVITVGTVKSHINHILGKLAAHNRTEAVAHARTAGLIR